MSKKFVVQYKANHAKALTPEPATVAMIYEHGKIFGWSGELNTHGMTDHHIYSIEATDKGTTLFKQEDGFHGAHSKFMNFLAKHQMKSAYKKFNLELKARVESLYPR